jgi:hypothetical protein
MFEKRRENILYSKLAFLVLFIENINMNYKQLSPFNMNYNQIFGKFVAISFIFFYY